ncbi:hypothetical protein [Brachybacterium sp. UNK5269]|uniref:hypothetical protein n=1 Tax=Brachybacterium sp. UNK5269 TaxID=3408576 RepID=UPI003BB14708
MSNDPTPDEAQALLAQASQSASTTKAGSSWPQIAGLLTLGAASSLALPAIAFAPSRSIALPVVLVMVWIAAAVMFMMAFNRSVKRGFSKRWLLTIATWGVCWVAGMLGASIWFVGQMWFLAVACAALTLVTMLGAWVEATR